MGMIDVVGVRGILFRTDAEGRNGARRSIRVDDLLYKARSVGSTLAEQAVGAGEGPEIRVRDDEQCGLCVWVNPQVGGLTLSGALTR